MKQVLFVTGMGRSGTSALTRLLSLAGLGLPQHLLQGGGADNPRGYWEPEVGLGINERFLKHHGSSWYDPSFRLQYGITPNAESSTEFVETITDFLKTGFVDAPVVVLKEPRITAVLPYWIRATFGLGLEPKFVQIYRHPDEVAASLLHRDGLPYPHSMALWIKYNLLAERETRGRQRTFVSYDSVLRDGPTAVDHILGALDISGTVNETTAAAMNQFLAPDLRHHQTSAPPTSDPGRWVSRTYDWLGLAGDGGVTNSAELDQVFEEVLEADRHFHASYESYFNLPTNEKVTRSEVSGLI